MSSAGGRTQINGQALMSSSSWRSVRQRGGRRHGADAAAGHASPPFRIRWAANCPLLAGRLFHHIHAHAAAGGLDLEGAVELTLDLGEFVVADARLLHLHAVLFVITQDVLGGPLALAGLHDLAGGDVDHYELAFTRAQQDMLRVLLLRNLCDIAVLASVVIYISGGGAARRGRRGAGGGGGGAGRGGAPC